MRARRMLAGLGLLLAACTSAACAQVVSGTGAAAPDVQGQITASPSGSPSSSDDSSSTPSPSSSSDDATDDSASNDGTSAVCQALDKSAVESAFGGSVSFGRSSSSGCQIEAQDGRAMIVAVFDYLHLT